MPARERPPREKVGRAGESTAALALAHAFRLLGLRSHSRRELEEKLHTKGFEPQHAAEALGRLGELGLLDDRAFALEFIRSRSRRKPAGRLKLRAELRRRGIGEPLIDELLRDYDAKGPCLQAAEKKLRTLGPSPGQKEKEKLTRFLSGRGFVWEEIREALEELWNKDDGGRSPLREEGEDYA